MSARASKPVQPSHPSPELMRIAAPLAILGFMWYQLARGRWVGGAGLPDLGGLAPASTCAPPGNCSLALGCHHDGRVRARVRGGLLDAEERARLHRDARVRRRRRPPPPFTVSKMSPVVILAIRPVRAPRRRRGRSAQGRQDGDASVRWRASASSPASVVIYTGRRQRRTGIG